MSDKSLADAILYALISPNESDGNFETINIVDGFFALSRSLHALGISDATTRIGAIELLSKEIRDGSAQIADSLQAVGEGLTDLAEAVSAKGMAE